MRFGRHFTGGTKAPKEFVEWKQVDTVLKDEETGKVIYDIRGSWVPAAFSPIAANILVGKYFRMAGVPSETVPVEEKNLRGEPFPAWLQRRVPKAGCTFGAETHAFDVFHRLAGFWAYWGWMYGYFDAEADARIFYEESIFMLANQIAAPNTPQWFNAGLSWAYGITREPKGCWRVDPVSGQAQLAGDYYKFPGIHACFILGLSDHLFGPAGDGIYDNVSIETRAFAQGGGAGSNFSSIRSKYELLSTGGKPTGLLGFLKVLDRSASVIKSGSGQRRSSKMVILDVDHPEIDDFINWKVQEEQKVAALIQAGYDAAWEGEAYKTVSGQNSNNSVRISDAFMRAVAADAEWALTARTTGAAVRKVKAAQLWQSIVSAAWLTGDPGVQFDDTHNAWNTCAADGRLRATNPCAEVTFLDNTACNLASLNVQAFFTGAQFAEEDFVYACGHWTTVLDISNCAAQLPSRALAMGTYNYRAIGLGHSGIGGALMRMGVPYDSAEARSLMAAVSALMTASAFLRSAELASSLGAFPRYEPNKEALLKVLDKHIAACSAAEWVGNLESIRERFRAARRAVEGAGARNAFVTLIAPTGTIGLLLGCDTLAIEPDFSIVKFKKLSGGGTMKIVNESVRMGLKRLGYSELQIAEMMIWVLGHNILVGAPYLDRQSLLDAGITDDDVNKIEAGLSGNTELRHALALRNLSDESKHALGIEASDRNIFKRLGVTREQYVEANAWICGHGTLEGAPHIKPEHLAAFDCASRSGTGTRFISPEAHVKAMAAVTPFISGAISKTVNLPSSATEEDVAKIFKTSWTSGIKNITVYRDGCKRSQPLMNPADMAWWDETVAAAPLLRGQRKRPPKQRVGVTQEFTVHTEHGPLKVWVTVGEDTDGSPCELWVDISGKQNPDFRLALKWWARAFSNALQHGQPLEEAADSFIMEEGGPFGRTDHPYLTFCKSIPDLILKWMSMEYLGNLDWCKRRPPLSALRLSHHDALMRRSGYQKRAAAPGARSKAHHHTSQAPILTMHIDDVRKCPFCGSKDIIVAPCPTCQSCGAQLGGCT